MGGLLYIFIANTRGSRYEIISRFLFVLSGRFVTSPRQGASKGEGLGNKFLANIRECDAIVHGENHGWLVSLTTRSMQNC